MAGKIFYRTKSRERDDAGELIVVAVQDVNLTVYQKHLYLVELEAIAQSAAAELIELPRAHRPGHEMYHGEEDVEAASAI